jgi:presenilin-like A22 family membrane protease
MADDDVVIEHPNREKAGSKATKAIVALLLIVSAALMAIIAIGGWEAMQGAKPVLVAYILIYVLLAFYIFRWRSGMLPVAAALGIVLAIFAAVAVPGWFARDKEGFTSPAIPEDMLGLLTAILVPIQILLIAFAMRGFAQGWHVEVERHADGTTRGAPATA